MGLLRHLNFSRAVILLAFVGSAVFGYLVYAQEQRLAEIEGVLRTAPMRMQALQAKALELDELVRQAASEGLGRQENPDDYIRTVARDPQVGVGAVDVAPSEASPLRGVR
jgi:hypothetical protein